MESLDKINRAKPICRGLICACVIYAATGNADINRLDSLSVPENSSLLRTLEPRAQQLRTQATPELPQLRGQSISKIDPRLAKILQRVQSAARVTDARSQILSGPALHPRQVDTDARVHVYIYLANTTPQNLEILSNAGVSIELVNTDLGVIQGRAAAREIEALEELPSVTKVTTPSYHHRRSGQYQTEGDAILKSNILRSLNLTGAGVKIGIISDGANDWEIAQGLGDLPAEGITTYGSCVKEVADVPSCLPGSDCNEGTAMAEIIHDIAPGASIAVGSAGTSLEFIARIDDLVNDFGADIIVDDLGYYNEPFFEDGPVALAVDTVKNDVLFVSAAGNAAHVHHEASYLDFSSSPTDNTHNFGIASANSSSWNFPVYSEQYGLSVAFLQWDDPFGGSATDLNLYVDVYHADTLEYLGTLDSVNPQTGTQDPSEVVGICNPFEHPIFALYYVDNPSTASINLEVFISTNASSEVIDNVIARGSVFGHPAVEDVIAVGAINADDPGNDTRAFYSSLGNAEIAHPVSETRSKPDLMAIDGVSVSGTGGFPTRFFGTSAAAPHVAGISALLKETMPGATVEFLRTALLDGATDLSSLGRDIATGEGRVDSLGAEALVDTDGDSLLNGVDPDDDEDGLTDTEERIAGSSRLDPNSDDDIFDDLVDNCPADTNPDQLDENMNGIGDICEPDDICFPVKISSSKAAIICL